MNFKRVFSIAIAIAGSLSLSIAQDKLAYFDENYAMPLLPEYKTVQAEMDAFNKTIKTEIDKLDKEYQAKLEILKKQATDPNTSQVILEAGQKELEALDKRIQTMEENAQKEGREKLVKKLQPINDKVSKALEDVAKEAGGVYVFRREALLYVVEENNISDLVLKKLGVTPTAVANRGNLKNTNKIGYFNQNKVVPLLPEFKKVQKDAEVFREFLKKEMEKEQQRGQTLMQEVEIARKNPAVTEAQLKPKMEELQKIDAKLQEMQQTSAGKVQEKYTKLMEPVIKTLQDKVNEVAKEGGYTYIFRLESSLYEPSEADISDVVLKKYGITPPPAENGTEKKN